MAKKNRKEIKKSHALMKELTIAKYVSLFGENPKTSIFPLHPNYINIKNDFITNIKKFKKENPNKKNLLLIVGDSLSDFTRNDLTACYPELNLGLAGQGSSYYERILLDTEEVLKNIDIKYILIECWGNEFLSFFNLQTIKTHSAYNFKLARKMYPNAKIILCGLPPVYDVYTNSCKVEFETHLNDLVNSDTNSTLILLWKKFSGMFGLFPTIEYSSDGVHFIGNGIIRYNDLIEEAKETNLKVII